MLKADNRKLIRIPFIMTILLCLFAAILLVSGLGLPTQYDDTFLGEMKYKLERLKGTEGKRIVLVGGSSIPFAVKSQLLKESFPDYEIVDYGMYADMGTVVMLDWARVNVHEGDIYILMPEQSPQTLSCYMSGKDVWQAADGSSELIRLVDSSRYEKLAAAFMEYAGSKLYYTIKGSPAAPGIYARSSFNSYGDIEYADREYNIMSTGYNPNDTITFSNDIITDEFIDELNDFAAYVTEKGGLVYYHFPAMNRQALAADTTISKIDSYYSYIDSQLDFPIIGNPHSSIMESGWFYDTNFHLNSSGAIVFTKQLIEDLKVLFKDTSVTAIELPAIPQTPAATAQGDNSCADCFTYEHTKSGWSITGLSETGEAAAALVIPVSYMDEPVTGITDSIFTGNIRLRELTIQPNIDILYDNMFKGCISLKKLILTGEPSNYTIGSELMGGADFLIYVPANYIDIYKRHYSWQKYGVYLTQNN